MHSYGPESHFLLSALRLFDDRVQQGVGPPVLGRRGRRGSVLERLANRRGTAAVKRQGRRGSVLSRMRAVRVGKELADKRAYAGARLRHVVQSVIDHEVGEDLRGKEEVFRNRGASQKGEDGGAPAAAKAAPPPAPAAARRG